VPELRPQPARQFQQDEMPHHVGLHVDIGVDLRVADPRLRRQVDDPVEIAMALGQPQHGLAVGDVALDEGESGRLAQRLDPRELEDRVVIVAEIVDADDRLASRQQGAGDVRADEPGDTCDENGSHGAGRLQHFIRR
jgi:hypothetical protein